MNTLICFQARSVRKLTCVRINDSVRSERGPGTLSPLGGATATVETYDLLKTSSATCEPGSVMSL